MWVFGVVLNGVYFVDFVMSRKEEDFGVIEEILNSYRIMKENPFSYAIEGALSEWLQLLLVIERIKQDKRASETLKNIANFINEFFENGDVNEQTAIRDILKIDSSNPVIPSYNDEKLNKWSKLSFLFETLDEGMKDRVYFSKVAKFQQGRVKNNKDKEYSTDLLLDVIPTLCDELSFSWGNLNDYRMGYSHELILKGFIEGDEIIKAIEELASFDNNNFQDIRYKVVSDFLNEIRYGNNINYREDLDFNKALKYRLDFAGDINLYIRRELLIKTVNLIRKISCAANTFWVDDESKLSCKILFSEQLNLESSENGVQIDISDDILIEVFNFNEQKELSDILLSKLEVYLNKNNSLGGRLTDSVKSKFNNKEHDYSRFGDVVNERLIDMANNYDSWVFDSNNYLFNKNSELKISKNVVIRGVKFSIWYEKYLLENKKNILNGASKYKEERDIEDSKLTIKQSYEFVKKFSLESLPNFIQEQIKERLYTFNFFDRLLLLPLNLNIYNNIKYYSTEVSKLVSENIDSSDFDEILSSYHALQELLSDEDKKEFDCIEIYEKLLNKDYERNDGSQLRYNGSQKQPIKRSKLESLLRYQLDIAN